MADSIPTLDEVAEYLELGRRSVYRLANEGKLGGRKVLGRWRFHRHDIDEWIRGRESGSGEHGLAEAVFTNGSQPLKGGDQPCFGGGQELIHLRRLR